MRAGLARSVGPHSPPGRWPALLTGVDVRYISRAGRPKNGRAMILKGDLTDGEAVIERETRIVKADPVRRMAYGVVYAPDDDDADGHTMSAAEIERAMLGFMAKGRVGAVDTDHDEATGGAYVAESWLVKAGDDGTTLDATFPGEAEGTWAVGIKVDVRYLSRDLSRDSRDRLLTHFHTARDTAREQIAGASESSVEPEHLRHAVAVLQRLPDVWAEASPKARDVLAGSVWPSGLVFDGERYRTLAGDDLIGLLGGVRGGNEDARPSEKGGRLVWRPGRYPN